MSISRVLSHEVSFSRVLSHEVSFHCLMKPVLILLIILTVTKNSSNCVWTIMFLMTLSGNGMKNSIRLTSEV